VRKFVVSNYQVAKALQKQSAMKVFFCRHYYGRPKMISKDVALLSATYGNSESIMEDERIFLNQLGVNTPSCAFSFDALIDPRHGTGIEAHTARIYRRRDAIAANPMVEIIELNLKSGKDDALYKSLNKASLKLAHFKDYV